MLNPLPNHPIITCKGGKIAFRNIVENGEIDGNQHFLDFQQFSCYSVGMSHHFNHTHIEHVDCNCYLLRRSITFWCGKGLTLYQTTKY